MRHWKLALATVAALGAPAAWSSSAAAQASQAAEMNSRPIESEYPEGPEGIHCPPRFIPAYNRMMFICGADGGNPLEFRRAARIAVESMVRDGAGPQYSGWAEAVIKSVRNKSYGDSQGAGQGGRMAALGHFVAGQIGVGSCTRHFYNRSDGYWAVGMVRAGGCHMEGQPADREAICTIAPHETAVLDYANMGDDARGAKIAIAGAMNGKSYSQMFTLNLVGCHIEHSGNTGAATLNDPADGDVIGAW